jgi:hypothetical protein
MPLYDRLSSEYLVYIIIWWLIDEFIGGWEQEINN